MEDPDKDPPTQTSREWAPGALETGHRITPTSLEPVSRSGDLTRMVFGFALGFFITSGITYTILILMHIKP